MDAPGTARLRACEILEMQSKGTARSLLMAPPRGEVPDAQPSTAVPRCCFAASSTTLHHCRFVFSAQHNEVRAPSRVTTSHCSPSASSCCWQRCLRFTAIQAHFQVRCLLTGKCSFRALKKKKKLRSTSCCSFPSRKMSTGRECLVSAGPQRSPNGSTCSSVLSAPPLPRHWHTDPVQAAPDSPCC